MTRRGSAIQKDKLEIISDNNSSGRKNQTKRVTSLRNSATLSKRTTLRSFRLPVVTSVTWSVNWRG